MTSKTMKEIIEFEIVPKLKSRVDDLHFREGMDYQITSDGEENIEINIATEKLGEAIPIEETMFYVENGIDPSKIKNIRIPDEKMAEQSEELDREGENVGDQSGTLPAEEEDSKGLIHQLKRRAELYKSICDEMGINSKEMLCQQNEFSIMRMYNTARRSNNDRRIKTTIHSSDGKKKEIEISKEKAQKHYRNWMESEPRSSSTEEERKRRRLVDKAAAMHEMWFSVYGNTFYGINGRVSRNLSKVCTPMCSGITGVGGIMSPLSRHLDGPVLIDQILNIARAKSLAKDEAVRGKALKAKLTALKNAAPLDSQKAIIGSYINEAAAESLGPGNKKKSEEFRNTMRMVALSFCATGTKKTPIFYPSMSLILAGKKDFNSISGFRFQRWYNETVPNLNIYAKDEEHGKCLAACTMMSTFNILYEDLNVVSTILGRKVATRTPEAFNKGLVGPRPTDDQTKIMNSNKARLVYFFKMNGAITNSGEGRQMFNTHYIKFQNKRKDDIGGVEDKIRDLMGMGRDDGSRIRLGSMMSDAMDVMREPNLFVGSKLYNLKEEPVPMESVNKIEVAKPFYWGLYGDDSFGKVPLGGKRKRFSEEGSGEGSSWM